MPPRFEYKKLYYYPHLKPADIAIWERFIDKYPEAYNWCEYDVWVGSGPTFDTIVNPETGGDAKGLYKLKIDVVGHKNGAIDLIEVKPRARLSALGQIRGYLALYVRDIKPNVTPRAVIITDQLMPDMPDLTKRDNVTLFVA